jgi:hypothetical protein
MHRSAPLMRFTRAPNLRWHKQPPPVSGITWCGLCRRAPLRLFDVPDDVWRHYIGPDQRHQVVCIRCWDRLTGVIDGGAYQAEHGGPLPLWSDQWRVRHGIAPDEPCPMTEATLRRFTISTPRVGPDGLLPPRTDEPGSSDAAGVRAVLANVQLADDER